jgi:hypothetical protein
MITSHDFHRFHLLLVQEKLEFISINDLTLYWTAQEHGFKPNSDTKDILRILFRPPSNSINALVVTVRFFLRILRTHLPIDIKKSWVREFYNLIGTVHGRYCFANIWAHLFQKDRQSAYRAAEEYACVIQSLKWLFITILCSEEDPVDREDLIEFVRRLPAHKLVWETLENTLAEARASSQTVKDRILQSLKEA